MFFVLPSNLYFLGRGTCANKPAKFGFRICACSKLLNVKFKKIKLQLISVLGFERRMQSDWGDGVNCKKSS